LHALHLLLLGFIQTPFNITLDNIYATIKAKEEEELRFHYEIKKAMMTRKQMLIQSENNDRREIIL
jgi:hypothetical protein